MSFNRGRESLSSAAFQQSSVCTNVHKSPAVVCGRSSFHICHLSSLEEFPAPVLWTRTEAGGEGLQREVAAALGVQGVEDVFQLLRRQRQLPVEPLPGTQKHISTPRGIQNNVDPSWGSHRTRRPPLAGCWSTSGRLRGSQQL